MSYEPTLIIVKESLDSQSGVIEEGSWQSEPKKPSQRWLNRKKAFDTLRIYLGFAPVKIRDIGVILVTPGGTQHNQTVRNLLDELNIEFATYE